MSSRVLSGVLLAFLLLNAAAFGSGVRAPLRDAGEKLVFLVFNLAEGTCPNDCAREIRRALFDELHDSREFTLVNSRAIAAHARDRRAAFAPCDGRDCAVRIGGLLGSDKNITGAIRCEVSEETEPVTKYVYRVVHKERFVITVSVHDTPTGKTELSFLERARGRAELGRKTRDIARKIIEYYRKRAWGRAVASVPLTVRAYAAVPLTGSAESRPGGPDAPAARWGLEFDSLAASAGYLKPLNAFSNIAHDGFGIAADARWRLVPWRSVVVSLGAAGYRIRDRLESIQSYYLAMALVTAGYSLSPARGLYVVPSLGFGYLGHIIYGDKSIPDGRTRYEYKMHYTYDPSLFAGGELQYALGGRMRLFLAPWYVYFFEKDENGQAVMITAGLRFMY